MSQIRRHNFPAHNRIKKRQDFLTARSRGSRYRTQHFFIHVLPTGREISRLGVTVSRKRGNAVVRNRIKRLLREYFRLNIGNIPIGVDVSIVVRCNMVSPNLAAVSEELNLLHGVTLDQEEHD